MGFQPNDNQEQNTTHLKDLVGIVVDVKDPLQLCRVKVKIEGLLETDDIKTLPWARPRGKGNSGRSDYGDFIVPELYSKVSVHFPDEDVRNLEYEARGDDATDTSQVRLFGEDYPKTEGKCDATGTWTRINKEQKYEEHLHTSGFYTQVDKDGTLHVFVPKSIVIHVGENFFIKADKNIGLSASSDLGLIAGGNTGVKAGSTVEILASTGTIETPSRLDLNSGTTFGTSDSINSSISQLVKKVDERRDKVMKLQEQILKAGKVAIQSLKSVADSLLGTRSS